VTKYNHEYNNGILHIDGYNLMEIISEHKTPLYVYSAERLTENYLRYKEAVKEIDNIICYAVKANNNSSILKLFASMDAGADVVSGYELLLALNAGIKPEKIVFSGVSKSVEEIRQAIKANICLINIESEQELEVVARVAAEEKITANVSFRINPDIDPKTHPKIATGLKKSKFGIPAANAFRIYEEANEMEYINVNGVHLHIGSQITDVGPFKLAAEAAIDFVENLKRMNIFVEYVDIGGGLGIAYENIEVPTPSDIVAEIGGLFTSRPQKLILEPGRSLVGNAGYLLTSINYIKKGADKNFIIVDAGFNDLLRPAMYESYHKIIPVRKDGQKMVADVVGPVCESGDFMALNREVEGVARGNVLAICDAGAYGFSMTSNYNSRPRSAEILIEKDGCRIIRRRENFGDLIATEK
jgi:diaminopimelate decarboxylase